MSKSNETTPNVPTLRFTKYHDDWSLTMLSEISNVVGGGTPDTSISSYWNGNIQWFTPTEVGHTKYVSCSARTISELGLQKSSAKILPQGTVLLSSRATVGESSIAQVECTTNQGFQSLIPKKNIYNEFLYYLTQTKKCHFIKYACGSTFLEISNSEIKKTKCCVPNFEEQKRIANFLSLIDKKMEVQNKIISQYETLIKGLSHAIFAKNKTNKIGDLVICKTSNLQESSIINTNGKYAVYGASGIIAKIDDYQFSNDAILVLKDGSKVGKIQFATNKYSVVGTSSVLIPKEKSDSLYIYFAMTVIEFDKYKVGSGIPHVYYKDYCTEKIYYPCKPQRDKITCMLRTIQNKLNIEKEILIKLQAQKAFLLSNLFI